MNNKDKPFEAYSSIPVDPRTPASSIDPSDGEPEAHPTNQGTASKNTGRQQSGPKFAQPDPASSSTSRENRRRSRKHEDKLNKAYKDINSSIMGGMSLWMAGVRSYQTLVDEWANARQRAMAKTLTSFEDISNEPTNEKKAQQAADAIVDQWTTFYRDVVAVQMKTAAEVSAYFGDIRKPEDLQNAMKDLIDTSISEFSKFATPPREDKDS